MSVIGSKDDAPTVSEPTPCASPERDVDLGGLRDVVIVTDHAHVTGGAAKVAISSACGLSESGLTVTFFAGTGPVDQRLHRAGVRVVCLDQPDIAEDPDRVRAMGRGLWNRRAARALIDLLSEFDPASTIMHCHGFSRSLSPAIGQALTRGPVKHVFTMHDYFIACPNGGFYDFRAGRICGRRPLGPACLSTNCDARHISHKAWRVLRQSILHFAGNMPRRLREAIYVSETQRRMIAPYLGRSTRLYHVRNPVEVPLGPRVPAEQNDTFLFVGRIAKEKGAVDFARAAAKLGIRAVFVGDGPEADQVRTINPDALVTGWLASGEVSEWLGRARCLVSPSRWSETFGLVVYEALASGVPVICGEWSAAAEAVDDGVTGLIYDTSADLGSALETLTAATAGRMSRAAFVNAARYRCSPREHADQLIEVYGRIMTTTQNAASGSGAVVV